MSVPPRRPPGRRGPTPFVWASAALHAAAVPALLAAPAAWPWVVGTLFADHLAILAGGLRPKSSLLGPNVVRDRAAARRGEIALTFDDGPDPLTTPEVLKLLAGRGVRASFFCVGKRVLDDAGLAREIAARGHRIENHTHTHPASFFFHGPARLTEEVARCQDAVASAVGRRPRYFRAPAGIRGPMLFPVLARHDLRLAAWTRRGFDTVSSDPESVLGRLARNLRAGDVLLLHDAAPSRGRRAVVLDVLPRLLDAVEGAGLRAGPLSDDADARGS